MLGVSWFDWMFLGVVLVLETHWYLQGRKDAKDFEKFKIEIENQLLETNQRLEIVIEKQDQDKERILSVN